MATSNIDVVLGERVRVLYCFIKEQNLPLSISAVYLGWEEYRTLYDTASVNGATATKINLVGKIPTFWDIPIIEVYTNSHIGLGVEVEK